MLIVSNILFFVIFFQVRHSDNNDCVSIDTTINRLRIDSIQLVIIERDSTIYNIKYDADEDILKSLSDTDSAAISRFLQLVTE